MRSAILIFILSIAFILISGCAQPEKPRIVCNPPYILVGTDCCLDKNSNSICDKDETSELKCGEHKLGESWRAEDNCNTCTCTENGVACTLMYCINETEPSQSVPEPAVPPIINETSPITNATPSESSPTPPAANATAPAENATLPTVSCEPPYIAFSGACCLDENYNRICDEREGITATPGIILNISLPTARCGDGRCYLTENSTSCPQDCGCPTGKVLYNGTCTEFTYVPGTSFSTMEICGNKNCKAGVENSSTCCKDCGCPAGQVCSNNKCSNITYQPSLHLMPSPDSYIVVVIDEITIHDDEDPAGPGELMLVTLAGSGDRVQKMSWPAGLWYSISSGGKVEKRIPVFALKESEMGDTLAISITAIDNDEMPAWLEGVLAVLTAPAQAVLLITSSAVTSISEAELQLDTRVNSALSDAMYGNEKIGSVSKIYKKADNWGVQEGQYEVRGAGMTVKYSIKRVQVPKSSKVGVKINNITISDTGDYFDGEVWIWMRAGAGFSESELSGVKYRFPERGTWSLGDNAKIRSGSCTMNERGECITNPILSFEQNGPFIFVEVSAWDEDNPEIGDDHDGLGEMSFVYLYSDFDLPPTTSTTTYSDRIDYPWVVSGKTIRVPMLTRGNMKVDFELIRTTG